MNTTNSNSNLPSRLRESAFKKYEPFIASAVAAFPNVIIRKADVGNAVFAARLRDAMASLATYRWETNAVDMDKFELHYPQIQVSHVHPDYVVVGSKECIKEWYKQNLPSSELNESASTSATVFTSAPQQQIHSSTSTNAVVNSASVEVALASTSHEKGVELKLLARLAALRLLANAVQIEIDHEQAEWLRDNFDVELTKVADKENTYTLI